MLREVVVDDEYVAARFHEVLCDARRRVRSDVREPGRVVPLADDDDGICHRPLVSQDGHGLRNGGGTLANGTVDADDVLVALVQDRIGRNRRLSRLPIAQDQLTLAASNGDQRVEDLEAGLEGDGDRPAVHDGRSRALDRQPFGGIHPSLAVEGPTQGVDDPPEQFVADHDVHDPARTFDLVSGRELRVIAKEHDADLVLVHIEGDAELAATKADQFLEPDAGEAGDRGDTRGDCGDGADLTSHQLRLESLSRPAHAREGFIEDALQALGSAVHGLFATSSFAGFRSAFASAGAFCSSNSATPSSREPR